MKKILSIGFLFFLSGLTSLVYQTLWVRVLSLGVGSTSTSLSIVLAIFFSGLSLGSWLAGRVISRVKRPILCYGLIEGAIGVYSFFLLPVLFNFHVFLARLPLTGSFSWFGALLKFVLVFFLLIFPTTLMGASLPVLIRIFARSREKLGKQISLLYGINTSGAAAGAFLSGFVLIPHLGIAWANNLSALINLAIFPAAYYLQKLFPPEKQPAVISEAPVKTASAGVQRLIPWVAAGTGFCSIAAEVVWNKYLGIFLGSNVFGLSLILSLFLLGIAAGSLALSYFSERVKDQIRLFQWLLAMCVFAIFLTTRLLNLSPVLANVAAYYFPWVDLFILKTVLAAIILFPPGAVLGALLPLGIRLAVDRVERSAEIAGKLYAVNTIGSILGSCAAGLFLIPILGSGATISIALALLIFLSLAVTVAAGRNLTKKTAAVFLAHAAALAVLPFTPGIRFENIIKSAYLQRVVPDLKFTEVVRYFARDYEEFRLIVEGRTGIITLSHDPQDGPIYRNYLRLKTNGLNESVYDTKDPETLPKYEALLGFLPLALAKDPQRAFVVGYGGGFTVDFLTASDLKHVFVAELEEGILKAADYVHKGKNPLLKRKNLKIEIEDARFILASGYAGPFDIIVSQPSHSWLAGVANLFTREFFLAVRENLSPDGVFSQWLNLYNMNPGVLKSILHTFYSVFPHGFVFTGGDDQELIMIGSLSPLRFDLDRLRALSAGEASRKKLMRVPIANAYDALAQLALTREEAVRLTAGAELNSDKNAFAEVAQSRLFYSERNHFPSRFILEAYTGDFQNVVAQPGRLDAGFYRGLLVSLEKDAQRSYKMAPILEKYRKIMPQEDAFETAFQLYRMERYKSSQKLALATLKKVAEPRMAHLAILNHLAMGQGKEAGLLWAKYREFQKGTTACFGPELEFNLNSYGNENYWAAELEKNYDGNLALCGSYLNKALGFHYARRSERKRALEYLEAYYANAQNDVENYRAMLALYVLVGQRDNIKNFGNALEMVVESEKTRLNDISRLYEAKGFSADAAVLREKAAHQ
ncbi:MAG: fused MFS/spermidine synthase [Elusimicrobiota bacterium]